MVQAAGQTARTVQPGAQRKTSKRNGNTKMLESASRAARSATKNIEAQRKHQNARVCKSCSQERNEKHRSATKTSNALVQRPCSTQSGRPGYRFHRSGTCGADCESEDALVYEWEINGRPVAKGKCSKRKVSKGKHCEGSGAPQLENLAADVPGVTRVT
jgi:hypothetical protein